MQKSFCHDYKNAINTTTSRKKEDFTQPLNIYSVLYKNHSGHHEVVADYIYTGHIYLWFCNKICEVFRLDRD